MSLNFHIVNFVAVFFFYSLVMLISYSFTQSLILTESLSIISKTILFFIYYVVMIMTLISHYKTMKSDNSVENNCFSSQEVQTYCDKCQKNRPERSHHCRSCNICILKMDHHCPWISNCVGANNQKTFYLMLFYSLIGCVLSFIFTLGDCYVLMTKKAQYNSEYYSYPLYYKIFFDLTYGSPAISCFFSAMMGLAIIILLIVQIPNIRYGMTSIEFIVYDSDYSKCPYYSDNFCGHFVSLFGQHIYEWFIPIESKSNDNEVFENNYIALK